MREAPPRGTGQGFNALAAAAEWLAFTCDGNAQTCAQGQGDNRNVVTRFPCAGRGFIEADCADSDSPTAERHPAFRAVPPSAVRNVQHLIPLLCFAVCVRVAAFPHATLDLTEIIRAVINHLVCGWETDTDCVCQLLRGHFLKHMSKGVLFACLVFVDASFAWRCGDRFTWFTQQFRCVGRVDHVVVAQFPDGHVR